MITTKRILPFFFCVTLFAQFPESWVTTPVMPEQTRRSEMYAFVNANIPPLPEFHSLDQWQSYRLQVRTRILRLIGIDDILAKYKLHVVRKDSLDRPGYTIEKIAFESWPGMFVGCRKA